MSSTIRALLDEAVPRLRASGSETPLLDAELLLGHVLGVERTGVLAHPGAPVSDAQRDTFRGLVDRRVTGEPVAYIRGFKEFHGLAFSVDPRVLIPRPDTETLVDLAIAWVMARLAAAPRPDGTPPLRAWDVATGSGAIAIAMAVALRRSGALEHVRLVMSDRSADALAVALENAVGHAVADRIDAARGDLLAVEPPPSLPVDLVTANLPYIPSAVLPTLPIAATFEPEAALDGGPDGLDLVRRLLAGLPGVLAPGGAAFLEIGADQEKAAAGAAAGALAGWSVRVHPDLAGRPRVLAVERPAA